MFLKQKYLWSMSLFKMAHNVPSIADGGALYHQSLIKKQKFKICKKIN